MSAPISEAEKRRRDLFKELTTIKFFPDARPHGDIYTHPSPDMHDIVGLSIEVAAPSENDLRIERLTPFSDLKLG